MGNRYGFNLRTFPLTQGYTVTWDLMFRVRSLFVIII